MSKKGESGHFKGRMKCTRKNSREKEKYLENSDMTAGDGKKEEEQEDEEREKK